MPPCKLLRWLKRLTALCAGQGKGKAAGSSYKFASVGTRFKRQLAELMEALHHMEPHYIRCIKPNGNNRWTARVLLMHT